ncbi:MAG: T9SS type A sorting domain-containing protein [Flavobacteriales bacterium]|nr:T9SS type A sorting domain-containing protein [Flavobacteriales bacterium]
MTKLLLVLALSVSMTFMTNCFSQQLLFESFETWPPQGWTITNESGAGAFARSFHGEGSLSGNYGADLVENNEDFFDWLVTPGISLNAGEEIEISYKYIYGDCFKDLFWNTNLADFNTSDMPQGNSLCLNSTPAQFTSSPETQTCNFTAPSTGTFYFGILTVLTNCNGNCGTRRVTYDDFEITKTSATSIDQHQSKQNFGLYPNPSQDGLVRVTNLEIGDQIIVYDAMGRVSASAIANDTNTNFDFSRLQKGVYWFKIIDSNAKESVKRFIIQ